MVDMGEIYDRLTDAVSASKMDERVNLVAGGVYSDMSVSRRDEATARAKGLMSYIDSKYHDVAKRGIMAMSGVSSDEYDMIMETDPARAMRLRTDFLATI